MTAFHADAEISDDKEVLTWEDFGQASREMAQIVLDSGFEPEIIISIARGGMIPGGAITYALGVKLSDCINVEFYTDVETTLPDPVLLAPLLDVDAIRGKKLLVVDDVADSGRTLSLVIELLKSFDTDARSAVLYAKPSSVVDPDYVWKRTAQWIIFPWSALPPVSKE